MLLDKPLGMSSNAALQAVRRLFGRVKAGHTGTLDPLATGLLPLCLGEATKFAGGLLDADKTYEAIIQLGVATTTGDAEGEPILEASPEGCTERLPQVSGGFHGDIDQMPPMFSALKHRGRPLYNYARAGQSVERQARRVRIDALELLSPRGRGLCQGSVQQGHLHPDLGPRYRTALGLRGASQGASADRDRPIEGRAGDWTGSARRAHRGRAPGLPAFR